MFLIDDRGNLERIARRPANWETLEDFDGYIFLSENKAWDAWEREKVAVALGFTALFGPTFHDGYSWAWLKRRAIEHCQNKEFDFTDPDPLMEIP